MSTYGWKPVSEVPRHPVSALFATFDPDDDQNGEPYLLDGLHIVHRGVWVREDGGAIIGSLDNLWWIDEEALFAAWPLKRPPAEPQAA
jgi:hypothetical protein